MGFNSGFKGLSYLTPASISSYLLWKESADYHDHWTLSGQNKLLQNTI